MLRARQRLGKYRIERRIADGGFATVYRAFDTIEGGRVALKIPHETGRAIVGSPQRSGSDLLEGIRSEVRLSARLDHPSILPIKNADFIDGHFVIALPLGKETLADRLHRRISVHTALAYSASLLEALAYAHERKIIHCDVKPDNLILFHGDRLRLSDFGIAKVAFRTIDASGSGTLGHVAPEQALGRPSARSDVFSAGLVMVRMFAGVLPEWPYDWPPPRFDRLRSRACPELVEVLRRAIAVDPRDRFADAGRMLASFRRAKPKALRFSEERRRKRVRKTHRHDWQEVRWRQFRREYGKSLEAHHRCRRCHGPVAEPMVACPWCGASRSSIHDETKFPCQCPRCGRGLKLDWKYCPWCYGGGFEPTTNREYTDVRYSSRCRAPGCSRRVLMPFMRYCPWCHSKVRRRWKVPGSSQSCSSCGWGILRAFWSFCPWCSKALGPKKR